MDYIYFPKTKKIIAIVLFLFFKGGVSGERLAPRTSYVSAGKTASSQGRCDVDWWHGGGGAQWRWHAVTREKKLQQGGLWGGWWRSQGRCAMSDSVICFGSPACWVFVIMIWPLLDTSMQRGVPASHFHRNCKGVPVSTVVCYLKSLFMCFMQPPTVFSHSVCMLSMKVISVICFTLFLNKYPELN